MKHILIPTDFSIASLDLVEACINESPVRITLLHVLYMPTGILDLLTISKTKKKQDLMSPAFCDAIEILKHKHGAQIAELHVEVFFGHGHRFLRNYLEAQMVTEIVLPNSYKWALPCKESANQGDVFKKLRFPQRTIDLRKHLQPKEQSAAFMPAALSELLAVPGYR